MNVFDKYFDMYEEWFKKHKAAFKSEVEAIRSILPAGFALEVGVGTGLFAKALDIEMGIDPSTEMLKIAQKRGIITYKGYGHNLPFYDGYFDVVLMVTTICFLDDVTATLKECNRIIKNNGYILIAFVDSESIIGQHYFKNKENSIFYKEATFYSTKEVISFLIKSKFTIDKTTQTLFDPLDKIMSPHHPINGFGKGSFVVVRGKKEIKNQFACLQNALIL